eukprot:4612665-Pyramimonas_sp.AAC.1
MVLFGERDVPTPEVHGRPGVSGLGFSWKVSCGLASTVTALALVVFVSRFAGVLNSGCAFPQHQPFFHSGAAGAVPWRLVSASCQYTSDVQ